MGLVGLPMTRSKEVLKGLSWGVRPNGESWLPFWSGLEMSRIVVVACGSLEGVEGAPRPRPRLRRALGGAGTPGRRVCPGRGDCCSEEGRPVVCGIDGSKVKWSVCGRASDSGRAE